MLKIFKFLFTKDKLFVSEEIKEKLELYQLHKKQANNLFKEIRYKYLLNFFKSHKFRMMRISVLLFFIAFSSYLVLKGSAQHLHVIHTSDNLIATLEQNSIVIRDVINPELLIYLDAIASTESPIYDVNKNDVFDEYDTLYAYKRKCWDTTSSAIGRYQMNKAARQEVGLGCVPEEIFLNWPELQDIACYKLMKKNHQFMSSFIKEYEGKVVNGYYLTETGILSLAHALGATGAMNWIKNGCKPSQLPKGAPKADRRLTIQKYKLTFK